MDFEKMPHENGPEGKVIGSEPVFTDGNAGEATINDKFDVKNTHSESIEDKEKNAEELKIYDDPKEDPLIKQVWNKIDLIFDPAQRRKVRFGNNNDIFLDFLDKYPSKRAYGGKYQPITDAIESDQKIRKRLQEILPPEKRERIVRKLEEYKTRQSIIESGENNFVGDKEHNQYKIGLLKYFSKLGVEDKEAFLQDLQYKIAFLEKFFKLGRLSKGQVFEDLQKRFGAVNLSCFDEVFGVIMKYIYLDGEGTVGGTGLK